jgi:hypothetical protein
MHFSRSLGIAIGAVSLLATIPHVSAAQRPNVVLIFADDLGWQEPGFAGSDFNAADNHNTWEFSARVLATLGTRGQEMSKSGQENRGYTPRNDGLSAGRRTFQAVRAHRHPVRSKYSAAP